ncbi:trypsin-like peptidase domain-containing protein [Ferruginibacter sp. HRS2-29]|uniref:trypsin-like peptidase domain-containing protein n=1 Tax=Ferruginibacter sp. HRS2-29 TaxID=2487334 RepID=UPI0020CDAB78|nr:trypsin-like peptidase domain-containing protein [Ferruginibacter sp. HRS2-29]MCP9752776.1 serine protease [Ferruginibacter sp. HRS2-29]
MFINAIETASTFTRPIHTIMRTYGGKQLIPGASTIFFVNDKGYAVTCKHVVELIASADQINQHFNNFKQERQQILNHPKYKQLIKGLELKYKLQPDSIIQIKHNFVETIDKMSGFTWHLHPTLDLAIIKFNDYGKLHYSGHAKFLKNGEDIRQGKFLCRLGFPFPEFSNFTFNANTDDIEWTNTGVSVSPRFPLEGMVTRFLGDQQHGLYGIEMSTPGLRGQSGGPLFDQNGIVYGMQFSTKHLHLGFDLEDKEIMINNAPKKVTDYSFIHLGQCIHVNAIKAFLQEHQVEFHES